MARTMLHLVRVQVRAALRSNPEALAGLVAPASLDIAVAPAALGEAQSAQPAGVRPRGWRALIAAVTGEAHTPSAEDRGQP